MSSYPVLYAFPLYKEFFILVVSNVSLWLFVVFSWLLFLSSFTRCMMKWRWHWVFLISRFRFILAFFNGKNFKWIPQWNSGILLMVQFDFLVFTGFFSCYKIDRKEAKSLLKFIKILGERTLIKERDIQVSWLHFYKYYVFVVIPFIIDVVFLCYEQRTKISL